MSEERGQLSIHAENLLPIIKKWLYSDRDIFIRELVSNGCDAIAKRKMMGEMGESEPSVQVVIDKEQRQLRFCDNGVGMTAEEVRKYINQVAFSGASEFLEKYKDQQEQIIGHFGLGFYSAFMVAEKVRIETLSVTEGAQAVAWESDGGMEYEMTAIERQEPGATIILTLNEESGDYLEESTVRQTLHKYCAFMPVPIYLTVEGEAPKEGEKEGEQAEPKAPQMLNTPTPLYVKAPKDCTQEEYKDFYRDTFHEWEEPLFWIHLNVDYPFNLRGILYFPRLKNEFSANEGQVKLYSNQVFVADNIKEVIPEFLLLLKGVIDCPDLPLNVSRSFLQNDGYVRKLSEHITRKVADKLLSLFKNEREAYDRYWEDVHPFIKYGCIRDHKFYERVKGALIYKTTKGESLTLEDYLTRAKDSHENKVFYTPDASRQAGTVRLYEERDMDVALMGAPIDNPFMQLIETENKDVRFARVDADVADALKDSDAPTDKALAEKLEKLFKWALGDEQFKVKVEALKSGSVPAMLLQEENMRRYQEAMRLWGNDGMGGLPVERTLALNASHPLVQAVAGLEQDETSRALCKQIVDLAELSQQALEPARMTEFISRSLELMTQLAQK